MTFERNASSPVRGSFAHVHVSYDIRGASQTSKRCKTTLWPENAEWEHGNRKTESRNCIFFFSRSAEFIYSSGKLHFGASNWRSVRWELLPSQQPPTVLLHLKKEERDEKKKKVCAPSRAIDSWQFYRFISFLGFARSASSTKYIKFNIHRNLFLFMRCAMKMWGACGDWASSLAWVMHPKEPTKKKTIKYFQDKTTMSPLMSDQSHYYLVEMTSTRCLRVCWQYRRHCTCQYTTFTARLWWMNVRPSPFFRSLFCICVWIICTMHRVISAVACEPEVDVCFKFKVNLEYSLNCVRNQNAIRRQLFLSRNFLFRFFHLKFVVSIFGVRKRIVSMWHRKWDVCTPIINTTNWDVSVEPDSRDSAWRRNRRESDGGKMKKKNTLGVGQLPVVGLVLAEHSHNAAMQIVTIVFVFLRVHWNMQRGQALRCTHTIIVVIFRLLQFFLGQTHGRETRQIECYLFDMRSAWDVVFVCAWRRYFRITQFPVTFHVHTKTFYQFFGCKFWEKLFRAKHTTKQNARNKTIESELICLVPCERQIVQSNIDTITTHTQSTCLRLCALRHFDTINALSLLLFFFLSMSLSPSLSLSLSPCLARSSRFTLRRLCNFSQNVCRVPSPPSKVSRRTLLLCFREPNAHTRKIGRLYDNCPRSIAIEIE